MLFGKGDLLIPEPAARRVYEMMVDQGEKVQYEVLNGGHCTILKEDRNAYVDLVENFLSQNLQ